MSKLTATPALLVTPPAQCSHRWVSLLMLPQVNRGPQALSPSVAYRKADFHDKHTFEALCSFFFLPPPQVWEVGLAEGLSVDKLDIRKRKKKKLVPNLLKISL